MTRVRKIHIVLFFVFLSIITYYFSLSYSVPVSTLTIKENPEYWKHYIWNIFYFTSISNVATTVLFGFKSFAKKETLRNNKFIYFEFLVLESIIWTGFAYCLFLSRTNIMEILNLKNGFSIYVKIAYIFSTSLVHFFVPAVVLLNFLLERIVFRIQKKINENIFFYAFILLFSPYFYLIINLSIYFAFGASKTDNIYPFMDIVSNGWLLSIVYGMFTFTNCYLINLTLFGINNRFAKINISKEKKN